MTMFLIILGFAGVLLVLIAAHELGHMLASKRAGVPVEEFGIGFPPRLISIKRGETRYSLNLIPLGAFVKTAGENDPSMPGSLAEKGPWTRMGVYAAGPVVNIFLAFVLLSAFFMLPSQIVRGDGAMVHTVSDGSPAETAGIQVGDIILRIDDHQIREWQDVQTAVNADDGGEKALLIEREGSEIEMTMTPEYNADYGRYTIGVLLAWGVITGVEEGSAAETAGIQTGDTVLAVDNQPVYSDASLLEAIETANETATVAFLRTTDGETSLKTADLDIGTASTIEATGLEKLWVSNTTIETSRLPVGRAIWTGGSYIVNLPSLISESAPLIREDPSKIAVGIVGAGQLTVEAVRTTGFSNLLLLGGMISLGLALFNFIPIPPLDGGGMLIAFIEGVRRGKRLSPRTIRYAYIVGTAFMISVFVGIMYSDIARLVRSIMTGESGFGL